MKRNEILRLSKDELVNLMEAYTKLYVALDGLWFLSVENEYGHDVASRLNADVWSSLLPREAKRISEARKLVGGGIESVIEAFKYRPTALTKEFDIVKEKNRAIVRVTKCRSLHAMERDNREVSSCLRSLESNYPKFFKSVDSRAEFHLLKAPPRKSENDTCCEWEIEIVEGYSNDGRE